MADFPVGQGSFNLNLPQTAPAVFADSAQQQELENMYQAFQLMRLKIQELENRITALTPP